jgi:hypothetical protein
MFHAYRGLHETRGYARSQGEHKTLCFEEAFLIYLFAAVYRPRTIVGVGVQLGKSMRRLLDIKAALGLDSRVVVYCPTDEAQDFSASEAEVRELPWQRGFVGELFETMEPGLIFNDAHSHSLLQELVHRAMGHGRWMLALHDCGRGLCNPHMKIAKDDRNVTSSTGVWERHVLAEACGIRDPLSADLDNRETPTYRLRIFDTPHGLGMILPAKTDGANP